MYSQTSQSCACLLISLNLLSISVTFLSPRFFFHSQFYISCTILYFFHNSILKVILYDIVYCNVTPSKPCGIKISPLVNWHNLFSNHIPLLFLRLTIVSFLTTLCWYNATMVLLLLKLVYFSSQFIVHTRLTLYPPPDIQELNILYPDNQHISNPNIIL